MTIPDEQPAGQEAAMPAAAPKDPSSRAAQLVDELAKIRAEAIGGAKTLLRVLAPHSAFTHGGITVGTEPTPVPAHAVPRLMEAAGEAGVNLAEET
jgi:hypothetical protein